MNWVILEISLNRWQLTDIRELWNFFEIRLIASDNGFRIIFCYCLIWSIRSNWFSSLEQFIDLFNKQSMQRNSWYEGKSKAFQYFGKCSFVVRISRDQSSSSSGGYMLWFMVSWYLVRENFVHFLVQCGIWKPRRWTCWFQSAKSSWWDTLRPAGMSSSRNGYSDGLWNLSKWVRTPVTVLHSHSSNYYRERYEPPYPPSCRLNSTATVLRGEWFWH